jgi:hypothetical protein
MNMICRGAGSGTKPKRYVGASISILLLNTITAGVLTLVRNSFVTFIY